MYITGQLKKVEFLSVNTCDEGWMKSFLIKEIAGKSEFVTSGDPYSSSLVTTTFATNRKIGGVKPDAFPCLPLVEEPV